MRSTAPDRQTPALLRRRAVLVAGGAVAWPDLPGARAASAAAATELKVWTWYPDAKVYAPAVERFEALNPGVRVRLTLLDSAAVQEKVPLALATGEDLDVVPVQPQMAPVMSRHLLDLDPVLDRLHPGWRQAIRPEDLADSRRTTEGRLKYLPLLRIGSMVLYHNVPMLAELGVQAPRTLNDFADIARRLKARAPGVLPVALNGRDGWTLNELLWTFLAQQGDYYDRIHFDGAPLDAPPMAQALGTLRRWFDDGVLSLDVLDFDYGRSQQLFTAGRAATYIQGSWESWLLAEPLRKARGVTLADVGAGPLPVAADSLRATLSSYIEVGSAIPRGARRPDLAARWIHFLVLGEGARLMAQMLPAVFTQRDVPPGQGLLTSPSAVAGKATLDRLVRTPGAVRLLSPQLKSFNGLDRAINRVIHGLSTPEEAVRELQQRWVNHRRRFRHRAA